MPQTASICVFCGARPGNAPEFVAAAEALGTLLGTDGYRLVFGAGDGGIMGAVARAAASAGAESLGVIPTHLLGFERKASDRHQVVITENMHERKKVMFMNSDAIVVLPGGAGSLDELFEVVTWRQLDLHAKPIFLVNVNGYWDPLLTLMSHIVDQGFADKSLLTYFSTVPTIEALRPALRDALMAATE